MPKLVCFIIGLFLCAALGLLISNRAGPNREPVGLVVRYDIEAGKVQDVTQGIDVNRRFDLYNNSAKSIIVTRIDKSCQCTSLSFDHCRLAPSANISLVANVKTARKDGLQLVSGLHQATISIYWTYEDSGLPASKIELPFSYNIISLVRIDPASYDFGTVKAGGDDLQKTFILHKRLTDLPWSSIAVKSSTLLLDFGKQSEDDYWLTATLPIRTLPIGNFNGLILVSLLDSNKKKVGLYSLPVQAYIDSDVSVKPTAVMLGVVKTGEVANGVIDIFTKRELPITNENFYCQSTAISIKVERMSPDHIRLYYTFKAGSSPGYSGGAICGTVFSQVRQLISIPLLAYVE